MTVPRPDDAGDEPDAPSDVDAEFARIIAGMDARMDWATDADGLDAAAGVGVGGAETSDAVDADPDGTPLPGGPSESPETAEERRRRREQRRAERAAELAEFNAAKIERHNEMLFDDEHFVPSEPPPLPRPKARTIWAIVLLLAGAILMVGPPVLAISGNATLLLGLVLIVGGLVLLVLGLRSSHGDPGDADGWDDGARI